MTKPRLIGLTGYAGTGKDTVREILEGQYDLDGIAFADPIRDMLGLLLATVGADEGWMTERHLKEVDIPQLGASYRKLAQLLGTEWGRAIDPDFWVRIAAAKVELCKNFDSAGVVISDVRFPNEATWIRSQGGVLWRVIRPGTAPVRSHASEDLIASLQHDYVIDNLGTIDDLDNAVRAVMGRMDHLQEAP
jgi:hypothetical protein